MTPDEISDDPLAAANEIIRLKRELEEAQKYRDEFQRLGKQFERDSHSFFAQSCKNLERAETAERALAEAREHVRVLTEAIDGRDQCEDGDLVADVTACIRRADLKFEQSGGSSRHWVRECMLPELNAAGFVVVKRSALAAAPKEGTT